MSPLTTQEVAHLGEFRKSFHPRRTPGLVMAGSAAFCFLIGLLEFFLAANQYFAPARTVLSDSFRQDRILISAILGVVFILLALILLALYISHIKARVDLYANGVVVVAWRSSTALAWDEIMEVTKEPIYGRSRTPINWTYTLFDYDRRKTRFRGVDGLTTLGRVVEREVRQAGGETEE